LKIVLFGSGSSMIVDVEETCGRLGLEIAAIVKNMAGADHALARERIVMADDVGADIRLYGYIVPVFTPGYRLAGVNDAGNRGFASPATIVDPTAVVARSTTLGAGTYINSGAIIGAASRLGTFVFINRGASIGHHVAMADFVSIGPGAVISGEVKISRGAVIGAGAVVLPTVHIGANSVIGAGAVARESIPDRCLAVGNPARIVKTNYAGFRDLLV
jgi:sugar O-acyltransferase (sialic acid O-acetyltransferase NeuD family)